MQPCRQCSQHIYSCRRKGFSAHGLILLLNPGILLRVCTILMKRSSIGFFSLVNTPLSMRRHNMFHMRGQPIIEFIFAATEETIFVHVIISVKYVRALSNGDIEHFLSSSRRRTNDQISGVFLGSKRPRSGTSESFGQAGMVLNPSMTDYGTMEANMSINGATNENVGSQWGWDDDDRGMGMDIQALLSEFGDFGDFFENDALPLGESPGTAESQVPMFPASDGGELCSSPSTSVMDVPDRMLVSAGFPTFDNFNHLHAPGSVEDLVSENQETTKSSAPSQVTCMLPSSNIEFDHVVKAEALMSFAPEYGGVEAPKSEISSMIFRSPYIPRSCKVDSASSSSHYVYSATPPSPCCNGSHEKFTLPQTGASHNSFSKGEVGGSSAQFFALSQADVKPISTKASDSSQKQDNSLSSARTVLATDIECLVCQVSMCRL
ncbi:mediator of RNA polymerase II transcription subunit 13-like isoform X3 [Salvia divinorum]|uniref:Mediator of RNA polymerase II transcription subunit 13 n=1 Tax=Salvia divinorum TaxID=28513 RepID=A0ABD1HCR2_SALDI